MPQNVQLKPVTSICLVVALAAVAVLVHGYHFGIEDGSIYVPAVKKALDPRLYPFDYDFFLTQTNPMLFDELVALLAGFAPFSLEWVVFLLHLLSIFLIIWGCLRLGSFLFSEPTPRWAGVLLVIVLMTIPVAGTRLYIVDEHLHPRSLATGLFLLAVADVLAGKPWRAIPWLSLSAIMHPQMTAFGLVYVCFLVVKRPAFHFSAGTAVPLFFQIERLMEPPPKGWAEAMATRTHHLLQNWQWYEWIGILAPLFLFWIIRTVAVRSNNSRIEFLSRRTIFFGILFLGIAAVLSANPDLRRFATLQPLRSFQIVYLLLFLLGGGLIGQHFLKHHPMRWVLFFLPLCMVMFSAQRAVFPSSSHIELPYSRPDNKWVEAFVWIRRNTPADAVFALHPFYMDRNGEDNHGFRAYAERSMIADRRKDAGVSALFPRLATRWSSQVHDLDGWESFTREDFRRLAEKYGVTWVCLEQGHPAAAKLQCPFSNEMVSVCKIE